MRQRRGLEVIFSVFLGFLVAAFIGVGVHTFYPQHREYDAQLQELYRERRDLLGSRPTTELSEEEREQLRELDERQSELVAASQEAHRQWGRRTSIILIALATLVMAVSIVLAEQLPVLNTGLLLGGLFTMVYGVGWIVATDSAISRFLVITFALAVTLILGYFRFVHRRPREKDSRGGGTAASDRNDLTAIEERLRNLEQRVEDAARILGRPRQ